MQSEIGRELDQVDQLIAAGNSRTALAQLEKLLRKKVQRKYAVRMAWELVRCDAPLRALKLLIPFVRGNRSSQSNPTDEEKAAYAACLTRIGAGKEAITLLKSVSEKQVPRVHLYRGYALMNHWDYASALESFQNYIDVKSLTPYELAVGKLNLAACFVYERRHDEAAKLLEKLLAESETNGWIRIRGNLHELFAQNAVTSKYWKEAASYIERAEKDLKGVGGDEGFFVAKWKTILDVSKSSGSSSALRALKGFKQLAFEKREWETVRDCDRVRAITTRELELVEYLFFGTPYESFKKWVSADLGGAPTFKNEYLWKIGEPKKKNFKLDLLSEDLKIGSLHHRILAALSSDFYSAFRIAALHAELYPGMFFPALSGTHKIHEAIHKFRNWLEASKIPLSVEEIDGQYRLISDGIEIRVYRDQTVTNAQALTLGKLKEEFMDRPFAISEVIRILDTSRRSAQRLVTKALEDGELTRTGTGSSIRYSFSKTVPAKRAA